MLNTKWKQSVRRRVAKIGRLALCGLTLALSLMAGRVRADEPKPLDKSLEGIKFGILGYIDYSEGDLPLANGEPQHYNQFTLTRGYLTVEKKFQPWLGARFTLDLSQDKGDNLTVNDVSGSTTTATTYKVPDDLEGSYMVRVKYLYAVLYPQDLGPFTNMKVEVGMGHIPWLDFEEHVNPYRCQGTMAIERAGVLNSADIGVSIMGNFGGELEDAEKKTGNKSYNGRYGSWHIGIFNGGGYHAPEANQNKVAEGRGTLRPLPDVIPGLQLSYFYIGGDANTKYTFKHDNYWPAYRVQIGMLSFEHPVVTFTAQYFETEGNAKGNWLYWNHKGPHALQTVGQSYFLRVRAGAESKFSVLGRYDYFDIDPEDKILKNGEGAYSMITYGMAYDLHKGNLIMVVYEKTDYERDATGKGKTPVLKTNLGAEDKLQVVYQIKL